MATGAAGLRDARGCLTEPGLQRLRQAPPGQAPGELATHLAGCPRCQERLLVSDPGLALGRGKRRTPPPLGRVLVLFGLGMALALLAFLWVRRTFVGELP